MKDSLQQTSDTLTADLKRMEEEREKEAARMKDLLEQHQVVKESLESQVNSLQEQLQKVNCKIAQFIRTKQFIQALVSIIHP